MKKLFTILTILTLSTFQLMSQETIPLTAENWTVYDGQFIDFEGKKAFMGTALLNNYEFENGTIEWDMYTTGKRGYPGIFFRMNGQQDYGNFYIRPHKTNGYHYDALQYTPAYHGISCWQLYHGEGYTKEATIPSNQWIHYKLVVKDDQARVFIGDMENVALTIHNLEHGISKGSIVLNGQTDGSAYFANFSVTDAVNYLFGKKTEKPVLPGTIASWDVSESITNNLVDNENYPGENYLNGLNWKSINAEKSGMINLTKHIISNPFQPAWVYAKTSLHSDSDKSIWYSFGYSDHITIFLNGQEIYQGNNAFTSRDPSYAGLLGYFDKVKLNLKKGENDLLLLIGEQMGGWGFSFRNAEQEFVSKKLTKNWEIINQLNYPESVAWDKENKVLYVSNYVQGPEEYLSKISIDGKIIEKEWVKGLRRPTALLLTGDSLLVVERRGIAVVDIKSASIRRRIPVEGARFLNDIAISDNGKTIFIGDSEASRIYKLEKSKVSVWIEGAVAPKPNAMAIVGQKLIVGCMGNNSLMSIDILSGKATTLHEFFPGTIIDGIQVLKDGSLLVGGFNGILYLIDKSGKINELLNLSGKGVNFSDFYFISDKNLIVIPGLYSNSLVSYFFK
ncbi:MAG: DUF1080 domain-containing protein [Bacteroidetes bacterium]|nr:DUF1080 domain-containing protein [Bacteroidota bacterium]